MQPSSEIEALIPVFEAETKGAGLFTVIQYREWSNEYRIRTRVETSLTKPPISDGPRISKMLSSRAARKITESCYYMAAKHGGFKTFVTGTFSLEVRLKIKNGETTIQREVSRTMNSMQKMYQRGWTDTNGVRIEGASKPLSYCWVVEIPLNAEGEENPHVHMMLDWRVAQTQFADWSARIESIWGNGYFHLEKIKDPLCAGAYMAKAAGYMTKGANQDDQGTVKGNRYGISKTARAPGWYTVSESELGVMGKLISELHEICLLKYERLYIARNHLKKSLERCPKKQKHIRQSIGKNLQTVREKINAIPIVSSQYQLIFKGSDSFHWFLGWAIAAGWNACNRPASRWLELFNKKIRYRRNQRAAKRLKWTDHEWTYAVEDYEHYQHFEEIEPPLDDYSNYSLEYCQ
jgi:hypothetical protein